MAKTDGECRAAWWDQNNHAVGTIPPDFADVGFEALERELEALVSGSDAWNAPNEPDA